MLKNELKNEMFLLLEKRRAKGVSASMSEIVLERGYKRFSYEWLMAEEIQNELIDQGYTKIDDPEDDPWIFVCLTSKGSDWIIRELL